MTNATGISRGRRRKGEPDESPLKGQELAKNVANDGDYIEDAVRAPGKALDKAKGLLDKASRWSPKKRR